MEERGPDAMHFRFTHPKGIIHIFRVISLYNSYVWSPLSGVHCRASGGLLQGSLN